MKYFCVQQVKTELVLQCFTKQNFRVVLQLINYVLLSIVTYTSMKMHHTNVIPFNSNANVHVIVSGYVCFVNVTLSSTLKGKLDLLELFGY